MHELNRNYYFHLFSKDFEFFFRIYMYSFTQICIDDFILITFGYFRPFSSIFDELLGFARLFRIGNEIIFPDVNRIAVSRDYGNWKALIFGFFKKKGICFS